MKITAKMLKEKGACEGDIKRFKKQWPDGCRITRKNCKIAFGFKGLRVSVPWAVANLLSRKACDEYDQAVKNMHDACVKAAARCKCGEGEIELFYLAARG